MRITITASAYRHRIKAWEIRSVLEYPEYARQLAPRHPWAQPWLFAGRIRREPPLEILADLADPDDALAFHAMLLRVSTAVVVEIDKYHPELFATIADYQRE
jgi:hypothetical protein